MAMAHLFGIFLFVLAIAFSTMNRHLQTALPVREAWSSSLLNGSAI
jgi:hypothetical protein